MSDLTNEEYEALDENKKKKEMEEYEKKPLKDNAILISGDPRLDVVQWIALELLEKGFRVRIVCDKAEDATKGLCDIILSDIMPF